MFDFPANPAANDKYAPPGGPVYTWTGVAWSASVDAASLTAYVLKTGDTMTGALVLPVPNPAAATHAAHKGYVDEAIAREALYQGVWQVAANVPDLTPANVTPLLNTYSWIAITADPAVAEVPPAGIPGLSGVSISHNDTVIWNAAGNTYQIVKAPPAPAAAGTNGDVKSGFQTADHSGWIKLDGRAVSTLTPSQQTVAASLGFTSTLPNATNLVLMQSAAAIGTGAGSMQKTIAVGNLPAHNMTSSSVDTAVATTSSGPALNTAIVGTVRGRSATGGTGYYFVDAEGGNVRSIAHTHTVDIPNHSHTVALGGSGTKLDVTPASLSVNYFVWLGL